MKTIALTILAIFTIIALSVAQSKKINADNIVSFTIKNAGIKVDGTFKGLEGKISFDPKNPAISSIDVSIKSATVNTGNNGRDNHLRKPDYFDVEKYPTIRFVSKKIEATLSGFVATGALIIKGKSKDIKIPFTYTEQNGKGVFIGSFGINRLDYGVGDSSWILSDEATINLSIKTENKN